MNVRLRAHIKHTRNARVREFIRINMRYLYF